MARRHHCTCGERVEATEQKLADAEAALVGFRVAGETVAHAIDRLMRLANVLSSEKDKVIRDLRQVDADLRKAEARAEQAERALREARYEKDWGTQR